MNITVVDKLNPICEILGLIYVGHNYEKLISESIEELNKKGINGEGFVKKNLKVLDKYIKTFNKHKVVDDNKISFLGSEELEMYMLNIFVILSNEILLSNIDEVADEELRVMILETYKDMFEINLDCHNINSLSEILTFVKEQQDINEGLKWKTMLLLESPKKYYRTLVKAIEENKKAYDEALKSVEKPMENLLIDYDKFVKSDKVDTLSSIISNLKEGDIVHPTLAFASGIFLFNSNYYVGLSYGALYKEYVKAMGFKGDLILKLKALSDKSKLEIISILKSSPKYSLEIAEYLNLTPATVSYHMGALLECGMVTVEKKNGKVYYNIYKEGVQNFISELSKTLM